MIYSRDYSKEEKNKNKGKESSKNYKRENEKKTEKKINKKELVEKKATTYVNIRKGGGFNYDVVRILKTGEAIKVFYEPGAEWLETEDGNYIKTEFLK